MLPRGYAIFVSFSWRNGWARIIRIRLEKMSMSATFLNMKHISVKTKVTLGAILAIPVPRCLPVLPTPRCSYRRLNIDSVYQYMKMTTENILPQLSLVPSVSYGTHDSIDVPPLPPPTFVPLPPRRRGQCTATDPLHHHPRSDIIQIHKSPSKRMNTVVGGGG